jgi:hypothetical protein
MEDSTLRDYFEFESQRVAGASRRLANELDRKDALMGRLREDPLLVALHCAAQVRRSPPPPHTHIHTSALACACLDRHRVALLVCVCVCVCVRVRMRARVCVSNA